MSRLRFERIYPHPPEKVWRALSEPDYLARWLMPTEDFTAEVGCEFRFRTDPAPGFDGIVHCRVVEVQPPHQLRFTWRGGPIDTIVEFRLTEVPGGTRLSFEQSGFRGFKQWLVRTMLKAGFRSMYRRKLPQLLDTEFGGSSQTESTAPRACGGPIHTLRVTLIRWFTPSRKP